MSQNNQQDDFVRLVEDMAKRIARLERTITSQVKPAARAHRAAALSITNSTWVPVPLDDGEVYGGAEISAGVITPRASGLYTWHAHIGFSTTASGGSRGLRVVGPDGVIDETVVATSDIWYTYFGQSGLVELADDQSISISGWQNSAGSLALMNVPFITYLHVAYKSPI